MTTILGQRLDRFVLVFLDRLRCEEFFGCIKKCDSYQTEVEYLGFDVGAYGAKSSLSKVKVVAEWPTPTAAKDVSSFLGLACFYRKFIKHFSEIGAPLTELTKKLRAEIWGPEV